MKMTEPTEMTVDDTRYLLPSEIARLVYGYLKENHFDEVAEKFLNTSPHMKECLEMRNKHRTFMTKAHNLTLEEISNQCLQMNVMLLEAVNERVNQPKKFHDPVEALRFIIDPTSWKDCPLVTDEPMTVENDASSDICLDVNSPSERTEISDVGRLPNLNVWSESTSKELGILNVRKNRFPASFEDNVRPARNLDLNAVLNKSGKVKVLRPRHSVPVAGKTILRHPSDESELESSQPADENPVTTGLEPPFPESPSREDNDFIGESLASRENSLLETPSKDTAVSVTMRLPMLPAKASEDASTTGSRSRRKKSSGSCSGEQMLNKSSCSKIVPEIEMGHMLIQQTLIKNPKIHERIAENINKAINESPQKKMVVDPIDELNSTVKKVADETMNDPLCKDIINELLGCLTNANLGLDNDTDDVNNLTFADKFYDNATPNGSNFQSDEPVGTSVPANKTTSNYQSLSNYVSTGDQQQQTEIIFVEEMPGGDQNRSENQNFRAENQENTISQANVDIRSYFTSAPDIRESYDNVETIDGTVINVLGPSCSNLIPVRGIETTNQYCIARSVPVFIESAPTVVTSLAPVVNSKKRRARIQPCVLPSPRISRRLTRIAPKPSSADVENQAAPVILENNHLNKRTKK